MAFTKAILTENLSDTPGLNKREGKEAVIEARRGYGESKPSTKVVGMWWRCRELPQTSR